MSALDRRTLGLLVVTVILLGGAVALSAGQEAVFDTVLYTTLALSPAAVGALVATRTDNGLSSGAAGKWVISWSWVVEATTWTVVVLSGRAHGRRF